MLAQVDVASSLSEIAKLGIIAPFILLIIAALTIVWLAYQKEVKDNKKMSATMIELASKLTSLVEDTYSIVKIMPNELKEKLKPDLDSIQKTVDEIKTDLKR
jgi:transcription initiation factor IIF auxiliary subunit